MNPALEKIIPYNPMKEIIGDYYITGFYHEFREIKIFLKLNSETKDIALTVSFAPHIIVKVTNETYRGWHNSQFNELYKGMGPCGCLFLIDNSNYLKEVSDESLGLTDALTFKHYVVEDTEWTFDIASQTTPRVELFENGILIKEIFAVHHDDLDKANK